MSEKHDGGPAFPLSPASGMTLRDYFAAAALTGIIAKSGMNMVVDDRGNRETRTHAEIAYSFADSMIHQRK